QRGCVSSKMRSSLCLTYSPVSQMRLRNVKMNRSTAEMGFGTVEGKRATGYRGAGWDCVAGRDGWGYSAADGEGDAGGWNEHCHTAESRLPAAGKAVAAGDAGGDGGWFHSDDPATPEMDVLDILLFNPPAAPGVFDCDCPLRPPAADGLPDGR